MQPSRLPLFAIFCGGLTSRGSLGVPGGVPDQEGEEPSEPCLGVEARVEADLHYPGFGSGPPSRPRLFRLVRHVRPPGSTQTVTSRVPPVREIVAQHYRRSCALCLRAIGQDVGVGLLGAYWLVGSLGHEACPNAGCQECRGRASRWARACRTWTRWPHCPRPRG